MICGYLSFTRSRLVVLFVGVCLAIASAFLLNRIEASSVNAQAPISTTNKSNGRNVFIKGTATFRASAAEIGKFNGKIAFISDRQNEPGLFIWTMNSDGSNPTQLTSEKGRDPSIPSYRNVYDQHPKWSPDGTRIAFRSIGRSDPASHSIFVMKADGSDLQQVVFDFPAAEMGSFDWSPDGTKFLFDAGNYVTLEGGDTTANIFVASVDGKNTIQLTNDSLVMNVEARWSPDGKLISFVSDTGARKIHVMNSDGTNRHAVATGSSPSWSPDGSKILFVGSSEYASCQDYECNQLNTVNPDGTHSAQLTSIPEGYARPRYSPDGEKILFERRSISSMFNRSAIFVMDANGGNQVDVSNRQLHMSVLDAEPDWQPLPAAASNPSPSLLAFSAGLYTGTCSPSKMEVTIARSGNLSEAVTCDYQTHTWFSTSAPVHLNFASGETSKTIQISGYCDVSDSTRVILLNNSGNVTFVGGVKNTTVLFVGNNSNPVDNPAFFVRQQYRDFLNREPDPMGLEFWTNNIESCGGGIFGLDCQRLRQVDVSAAFFLSIEFEETGYLVYRTYKTAYGNLPGLLVPVRFNEFTPDTQKIRQGVIVGQSNWQQLLETNKQNFATEFVQRSRFVLAYPTSLTPGQFVDALFANAGVAPSASERQAAVDEFGSAPTSADAAARARALRRVAENSALSQQEFNRAFVLMQYFGYLQRNPSDAPDADFSGYDFWLNKLNSFNGDYQKAEMVKAFITSSEYRNRFSQ